MTDVDVEKSAIFRPRSPGAGLAMLQSDRRMVSIDQQTLSCTLDSLSAAAEDEMPNQKAGRRYRADITAASFSICFGVGMRQLAGRSVMPD